MPIAKIQYKGQMTIPSSVRKAVGLPDGSLVEVKAVGGKVVVTPKPVIDRSTFPAADDRYTPAQRRAIDREISKGVADVKAGRVFGPFNTAEEMAAAIEDNIKKLPGGAKKN